MDAMNGVLVVLILVVVAVIVLAVVSSSRASGNRNAASLADAKADARRVIERLGGRCSTCPATTTPPPRRWLTLRTVYRRLLADRAGHYRQAGDAGQGKRDRRLYYVRAARTAMGMDPPGPELESMTGQKAAGAVTEDRKVQFEGREIEASPQPPSPRTPNYYPPAAGSRAVRPRRWYSEPWWKTALVAGAWGGVGSVLLFDALFSGMHGVDYGASGFENGFGSGFDQGYDQGV